MAATRSAMGTGLVAGLHNGEMSPALLQAVATSRGFVNVEASSGAHEQPCCTEI